MSKIFINYRRDDNAAYAGRLYDRLADHFGRDHIFMDIDQIAPGEDFIEVIHEKLTSVQVAVVLIGKHWLDITDDTGQRRLDNPDDFVRLEIATLLERKIRVIPILVGGATIPQSTQLPECLVPLIRRNAYEITDTRFHPDVDKLIQALEKIPGVQTTSPSPEPAKKAKISFQRLAIIFGAGGFLIVAAVLFNGFQPTEQETVTLVGESVSAEPEISIVEPSAVEDPNEKKLPFEPEMVSVPPGDFLMGSPKNDFKRSSDEEPQHPVSIDYAFEIGKYEVTFDEYDAFAEETNRQLPDDEGWGRDNRPVINVSFDDAQAYIQWLSAQTGRKYRLPTEAEWEYVARAGGASAFWWGNDLPGNRAVCRVCGKSDKEQTELVGSFQPNPFELYDTVGNVGEWTQDCWHMNYQGAPVDGSAWLKTNGGICSRRVFRGGSWTDIPRGLRSANRGWGSAGRDKGGRDFSSNYVGFRIARDR